MRFVINFLKMLGWVAIFVSVFAVSVLLQSVVNYYLVPLWIQWTVGIIFVVCFIGALVKTDLDKERERYKL